MHNLSDIEKTISNLPPEALAQFRAWFARFDAAQWDKQLEADIKAGKLDKLAQQAREDFENGRCTEL